MLSDHGFSLGECALHSRPGGNICGPSIVGLGIGTGRRYMASNYLGGVI